jgi:hypothetical protein
VTIRTEVTPEWQAALDEFTPEQQALIVDEAEHLANAMKYKNDRVRISTNGALEVLFAIGCAYNRMGKGNCNGE